MQSHLSAVALFLICADCSPRSETSAPVPFKEARNILVEIDHMPGAEPSLAPLSSGLDPWLVFQANLAELRPPQVGGINDIRNLGTISATAGEHFTDTTILSLASQHRDLTPGPDDAHIHILFLDGQYGGTSKEHASPKALHIEGSRVIAVFGAAASDATDLERLLEQATLLHELGHLIGLVGLDIPNVGGHEDPASPGHCTESECILRSSSTITDRLASHINGGPIPLLFGPLCLGDASAHFGASQ